MVWALIKPLTDITIYYIAFEVVIKQHIPSFVAYLFVGLIVWNFFVESTTGTVQILKNKKFLYEYNNMEKIDIYLSTILSNCIGLSFNLAMFFAYFLFVDRGITNLHTIDFVNYWYLIPLFLTLFVLAISFSMILSSIYIQAKDIHQIWQVSAGLLFILTPIVFKTEDYIRALPLFAEINPMAGLVINFRRVIMQNLPPDFYLMGLDMAYAAVALVAGLLLLRKWGSKAAEKL